MLYPPPVPADVVPLRDASVHKQPHEWYGQLADEGSYDGGPAQPPEAQRSLLHDQQSARLASVRGPAPAQPRPVPATEAIAHLKQQVRVGGWGRDDCREELVESPILFF